MMPRLADRARQVLPRGLAGLATLACAACCAIPWLLTAGAISGAGWGIAGSWMPGMAVVLTALAGAGWWWARRRRGHRDGCAGGMGCACGT
jgi:mercuric ion transport protein